MSLSDTPQGDIVRKGKFIAIVGAAPAPKTARFYVLSEKGDPIGQIAWYPRWRTYTFGPDESTVFEQQCLREIAQFLDDLMTERRRRSR